MIMTSKNDTVESLVGVFLGFLGAVAIAKLLSQKRCNNCGNSNPNSNTYCQYCGRLLQ